MVIDKNEFPFEKAFKPVVTLQLWKRNNTEIILNEFSPENMTHL